MSLAFLQLLIFPTLNLEGHRITLSHQGDSWTVDIKGERADRLTIPKGYEAKYGK